MERGQDGEGGKRRLKQQLHGGGNLNEFRGGGLLVLGVLRWYWGWWCVVPGGVCFSWAPGCSNGDK